MNKGIIFAVGAYFLWGISPIYWKLIQKVPTIEIIAHRIVLGFYLCDRCGCYHQRMGGHYEHL